MFKLLQKAGLGQLVKISLHTIAKMLIVAWVVYNMYIEYSNRQTYDFERVKSLKSFWCLVYLKLDMKQHMKCLMLTCKISSTC